MIDITLPLAHYPLPTRHDMKIVVLDAYAANPGDISWDELHALGPCVIHPRTSPDQLIPRLADADIALTNKVVFTAQTMDQLPQLKYIGVLATGYNIVDIPAARARGIVVTNIPAYSTASVAQMVFAHILNITQHVQHHSDEVHRGRWTQCPDFCFWDTPLTELAGKQIGIVGLGNTGRATARVAMGFGMKIAAYTSKHFLQLPHDIRKLSMDELFAESDVVSLHCPLTPDTHHLVDTRRLSLMKPSAILINTGRGPLVDEQALADALKAGRIRAAGLDVLSSEPPSADNPLLTAPHCYITPHIAWATLEARQRLHHIMVDNIRAFQAGKPINNVAK